MLMNKKIEVGDNKAGFRVVCAGCDAVSDNTYYDNDLALSNWEIKKQEDWWVNSRFIAYCKTCHQNKIKSMIENITAELEEMSSNKKEENMKKEFILKPRHKFFIFLGKTTLALFLAAIIVAGVLVVESEIKHQATIYHSYPKCCNCNHVSTVEIPVGQKIKGRDFTCANCGVECTLCGKECD